MSCRFSVVGLALALALPAPRAIAAGTQGRDAAPSLVPLPADAMQRLRSGNPDQISSALDDVRVSGRGGASAVPSIAALLKDGLPAPLTLAAIQALGDTESAAASEVLIWYTHHRSVELRRGAVAALAKTRGPDASHAMRSALSDSDAGVRGLAASSLGGLKAADAVPDLFLALDHDVSEAAISIGQLCSVAECERLAAQIGHLPFDVVTGGLSEVLFRPTNEVDEASKIKLVARLRDVGTAEAHKFLKDVQSKWPAQSSPRVKQALDEATSATVSSPGSANPDGAP